MTSEPTAAVPIVIDRDSTAPLAVQLADALRQAATEGQLRAGDRLPSTRMLARRLSVSRTVIAVAYEQLHAEGWIAGKHGSGTYVTTTPPVGQTSGAQQQTFERTAGPEPVDLAPGATWIDGIDRAAWRRAWRAAADAAPLPRAAPAGLAEYREVVVEHLLRHRGLTVSTAGRFVEDTVLATAGTTAAIAEFAVAALDPGDSVAVEDPGYQRAVQVLRAAGLKVLPAPVDAEGLLVDRIPTGVRAVYCTPAHQYPLGGRLAASRRVDLVRRARADGFLVIEDDYDGELRYDVAPLPLLTALAPDVVVHLGTTSKTLTATLSAGWMVAPPPVTSAVLAHRQRGSSPPPAGQRILVELARHGDLGRHLRKVRRELSARRDLVVNTLQAAEISTFGDDAGAHVVLPLSSARQERQVIAEARRHGLRLAGLASHYAGRPSRHGIALGYTGCSREHLLAALDVLAELIHTADRLG